MGAKEKSAKHTPDLGSPPPIQQAGLRLPVSGHQAGVRGPRPAGCRYGLQGWVPASASITVTRRSWRERGEADGGLHAGICCCEHSPHPSCLRAPTLCSELSSGVWPGARASGKVGLTEGWLPGLGPHSQEGDGTPGSVSEPRCHRTPARLSPRSTGRGPGCPLPGRAGARGNLPCEHSLDRPSCHLRQVTCFPVSFCLLQKVGPQAPEKLGRPGSGAGRRCSGRACALGAAAPSTLPPGCTRTAV